MSPSASASPLVSGILYLKYSGGAGTSEGTYGFVASNLDGSDKAIRSLGTYERPNEVVFVHSRDGRYLAWGDQKELSTARSANLDDAITVAQTNELMRPLAISDDGSRIAYQVIPNNATDSSPSKLFVVDVSSRKSRLVRTFSGPLINCLGDAAFNDAGDRLAAVGCGEGNQAGLVVIDMIDGKVLSEDDSFSVSAGQIAFSRDLATLWFIDPARDQSDLVRLEIGTKKKTVIYHSPPWRQSDGSVAPNLGLLALSPNEQTLAFPRLPKDQVPTVQVVPSYGGAAMSLARDPRIITVEAWSPDGKYVAISLDRSGSKPSQRILFVDPNTKESKMFDDSGEPYLDFLAWITS